MSEQRVHQPSHHREKVRETPLSRFFGYYPGTVSVITVATKTERNIMSAGWHAALSMKPVLYGVAIGRERSTHRLILEAGSFGVSFLPFSEAGVIAAVGSVSLQGGEDKFERFGVQVEDPIATTAPIPKSAYLSYECTVYEVHPTGDHDWVVGEVQAVHYDPDAFDERWMLNPERAAAAIYYGRAEYQALGPEGARGSFFASPKKR
ncbi:hypothetical protein BH24DEI1_BH24DEI1_00170 [soil metagenome]|nr:flavin reductase family protein [Deinococcota bacterium]